MVSENCTPQGELATRGRALLSIMSGVSALLWLSLTLLCGLSCEGAGAETKSNESVVAAVLVAPVNSDAAEGEAAGSNSVERVVAVGDVHGDLGATRAVLRMAKLIDDSDQWVGGRTVLVQTGDQLDRGDDEQAIVELFQRLKKQASMAGGRVVALNGNHEIMNVQGDFRYVTPRGMGAFAGVSIKSPLAISAPVPTRSRAEAFFPGGQFALVLAERDVIAVVGDSVFVHGGVLPEHVTYGIERINREVRQWMKGQGALPAIVAGNRGPVWTREFSQVPLGTQACARLAEVLQSLGVRRMVVGHTVQKGGITSACSDTVYRIDVGLAAFYGTHPLHALEILPTGVNILQGSP